MKGPVHLDAYLISYKPKEEGTPCSYASYLTNDFQGQPVCSGKVEGTYMNGFLNALQQTLDFVLQEVVSEEHKDKFIQIVFILPYYNLDSESSWELSLRTTLLKIFSVFHQSLKKKKNKIELFDELNAAFSYKGKHIEQKTQIVLQLLELAQKCKRLQLFYDRESRHARVYHILRELMFGPEWEEPTIQVPPRNRVPELEE